MKAHPSWYKLAPFLLIVTCARATTISGTVTGQDGVRYANGMYSATLVNSEGLPLFVAPGNTAVTQRFASGSLDANGSFAVDLVPNSDLAPDSQWAFRVCSSGSQFDIPIGPQCFTSFITISGQTQSVSSVLSAVAPAQTAVKLPSILLPIDPTLDNAGGIFIGGDSDGLDFNTSSIEIFDHASGGGLQGVRLSAPTLGDNPGIEIYQSGARSFYFGQDGFTGSRYFANYNRRFEVTMDGDTKLSNIHIVPVHVADLPICNSQTVDTLRSVDDAMSPASLGGSHG